MILIDYNAIAIGNIVSQKLDVQEDIIRHMILNSLRMYRKKFGKEYGELVICCDSGGNWRKEVFPEYKAKRKIDRDKSDFNWEEVWRVINLVRKELDERFPYKVVEVWGCEGDDVIATMADYTNEFGNWEKVMIVSADKDFAQLQKYDNINQFSTITKKFIKEENPQDFLFTHICKGDGSDGVPNVMSPDDIFLQEGVRQNVLRQAKIDLWSKSDNLREVMGEEIYRNYLRNKKMIDLSETPQEFKDAIINTYENANVAKKSGVMNYLIEKRCRYLLESLNDFIQ